MDQRNYSSHAIVRVIRRHAEFTVYDVGVSEGTMAQIQDVVERLCESNYFTKQELRFENLES